MFSLELEDLILAVAQLLQSTGQIALVLRADLGAADGLVQTRGSANKELDVVLLGLWEHSLQQVLGDEALTASPALGRVVQNIEGPEALGIGVLEVLELLLQEDVILGDIAKNQSHLSLVLGVLEDLASQLVHRGDTSATSNQGDVVVLVSLPRVLGKRSLERHALVDIQAVEVLRHGPVRVRLDDELKEAGLL